MSKEFRTIFGPYKEMSVRYDRNQEALWCYFRPEERPCISLLMLKEYKQIQQAVIRYFESGNGRHQYPISYLVMASQKHGVFNLGSDLSLLIKLIEQGNRQELLNYASRYIDICYMNAVNLNLPLTTISFVQGAALGGGFELAVSSNYLIAVKYAQMGLPEIGYNLFPGMGACSFLIRKVGMGLAEKMITTGNIYCGPDLYKMGIIDILAESGMGYEAVDCFIRKHRRFANGLRSIQKVRQLSQPIAYEELIDISQIWVDTALQLKAEDLKAMACNVHSGIHRHVTDEHKSKKTHLIRTKQDRRINQPTVTFPLTDNYGYKVLFDRRRYRDRRVMDILQVSNR